MKVKHFALPSFTGYQTWPYHFVTRNDESIGEEGFLEKIANSPLISGIKDLFDRDVVMTIDNDANEYPSTMPKNLSRAHDTLDSIDNFSQDVNDSKFDDYLEKYLQTKRQHISRFENYSVDSKQDDDLFNLVELLGLMSFNDSNNGIFDSPEDDINEDGCKVT